MIPTDQEISKTSLTDAQIEERIGRKLRRYERSWILLKKHHVLTIVVTTSNNLKAYHQHANTIKRAIQKEKYNDEAFKVKHPDAIINCTKSEKDKTIRFSLDLNDLDAEGLSALASLPNI